MKIDRFSADSAEADPFRFAWDEPVLTEAIAELLPALVNPRAVFVVGGFVRRSARATIEGVDEPLGDLDLIVESPRGSAWLDESLLEGEVSRNVFGGFRWFPVRGFRHVDIWSLASHYSIREFKRNPAIEEAMWGFPFNLERAALDLINRDVYEGGLVAGLRARRIEFDAVDRYLLHLQAIRAVLLLRKTNYELGKEAKRLVSARPWFGKEQEMTSYLLDDGWSRTSIAELFQEANSLAERLEALE